MLVTPNTYLLIPDSIGWLFCRAIRTGKIRTYAKSKIFQNLYVNHIAKKITASKGSGVQLVLYFFAL